MYAAEQAWVEKMPASELWRTRAVFLSPDFAVLQGKVMALHKAAPASYPSAVFTWEGVELHTAQTPCLDSLKRGCWAGGNRPQILRWVYARLKGWLG